MVQKSGDHQLRLVVYPMICKDFSTIPGGWFWDFWNHQQYHPQPGELSIIPAIFVGTLLFPEELMHGPWVREHPGGRDNPRDIQKRNARRYIFLSRKDG